MDSAQNQQLISMMEGLTTAVNKVNTRLDKIDGRLARVDGRLTGMERRQNDVHTELVILRATAPAMYAHPSAADLMVSPAHASPAPAVGPSAVAPHMQFGGPAMYYQQPVPVGPQPPHHEAPVTNAMMLPFALEAIAYESRRPKDRQGFQSCSRCQKPKGLPACFRARHFDWCVPHASEVEVGHTACGFGAGCMVLHWEDVHNWAEIVRFSKESGELGRKGVQDLDRVLFGTE